MLQRVGTSLRFFSTPKLPVLKALTMLETETPVFIERLYRLRSFKVSIVMGFLHPLVPFYEADSIRLRGAVGPRG